ncbi:MAG: carboxypeptidase-like regulatory domain-containing protein [Kofleriaceae bacterium]|nr:carboxypeptidase-like regulatory domain-containing protein [Kofleriaceae bacterium]
MARAAYVVLALVACRQAAPPLPPAGRDATDRDRDDGHGQLARASTSLLTAERKPVRTARTETPRRDNDENDPFGDDSYGGPGYGGATYASYRVPPWTYPTAPRTPGFTVTRNLQGVVEGTIWWRGATPTLTTACGTVSPIHANKDRSLPGAIVYIERVRTGRAVVHASGDQRPYTVGGSVFKRGCELAPRLQIIAPVPAALAIHGDTKPAHIKISPPAGTASTHELEEGGRIVLQATYGITKIEGEDQTLGAAWAIGVDSPYYALTDDRGRYRIEELPLGTYELTIWQPPIPTVKDGKLVYGAPIMVRRSVRVDDKRTTRLDISLGK